MKTLVRTLGLMILILAGTVRADVTPGNAGDVAASLNYNGVIAVLGEVITKPGREEELKALLPELRSTVSAEDGNLVIGFEQSLTDPTHFVFYGEWGHKSSFLEHLASTQESGFMKKLQDLLASPPRLSFYKKIK